MIKSIIAPGVDLSVQKTFERLDDLLNKSTPVVQFQYVDVVFPGIADTDMDIRHTLRVTDHERIRYEVVKADRAVSIYQDMSATRKVWGKGYIILRANAADAQCRLRLTVENT